MVELNREEIERFMSVSDFDFSTPAGWKEFFAERSSVHCGRGRDADGIHVRDMKNYSVGSTQIITTGPPADVRITVRTQGTGLALPYGTLYVYHPNEAWDYVVTELSLGSQRSAQEFFFKAGGPGKPSPYGSENWGTIYYVALRGDEIPGRGVAEAAGRKLLESYVRETGRIARFGRRFLGRGGAAYIVWIRVGNGDYDKNNFISQIIVSPEGVQRMRQSAQSILDSVR